MKTIVFVYDLTRKKGKEKTYLSRKIFGYRDHSNHGKYQYKRKGLLTPYISERWGRSVFLTQLHHKRVVQHVLKKNNIPYQIKKIR